MRRKVVPIFVIVLGASGSGLVAPRAWAQPAADPRAATAAPIYDAAVALMDRRKYSEACPKLEEVIRLVPEGIGAKFTLAECYEESGRLASAWKTFGLVEEAATKAGQGDRQQRARSRRDRLEPRIARLTIEVPERARSLPDLAILRDGEKVPQVEWGVPVPIDKGRHIVVATAGPDRFEKAVDIEKDGLPFIVVVQGLPREAPIASTPPQAGTETKSSGGFGVQRSLAVAAAGVGVACIGVGAFFGVRTIQKKNESNEGGHCTGNLCDDTGLALREEGFTAATVSTVMFVVGGAAIAGGAVLFFTAPKGAPVKAQAAIGPGTFAIRGSW
jgi:hypothetical protein